jgi:monoamine oxidase
MAHIEAEYCVVGAGFAGLTAALPLKNAGHSVAVLEACSRVGGRVWTVYLDDGTEVDLGGTWLGPGEDRIYALAKEMGVTTYTCYDEGDGILVDAHGKVNGYQGSIPMSGVGILALASLGLSVAELDEMAKQVPLDAPWTAKHAREWDCQSFSAWVQSGLNVPDDTARDMVRLMMGDMFSADTSEVSLLNVLFLIHATHDMSKLISPKGGVIQDRVHGGVQTIAERIAAVLGDQLHWNRRCARSPRTRTASPFTRTGTQCGPSARSWRCRRQ